MILLSFLACMCNEPPAAPPNVVLVVVDTLRKDRLSVYGAERSTTPRLEELADEGVRYDNVHSSAPWTLPSTASTLTGRLPSSIGMSLGKRALPGAAVTLAEMLGDHGYRTGAVVSHTYVGSRYKLDQGFETFDESNVKGPSAVVGKGVTNKAIRWVKEAAASEEPFFLFVHYFDPHYAYVLHETPWSEDRKYAGWVRPQMSIKKMKKRAGKSFSDADRDALLRIYDTEIAYTDAQIGRLLDTLKASGAYENSLIVFTHDHGEEFYEHGKLGHSSKLWGEVTDSPLVVKYPDGRTGVDAHPRALIDIFPTVGGVTGAQVPAEVLGEDLRADVADDRVRYCETTKDSRKRALTQGVYKYVQYANGEELYDRSTDPLEQEDLSDDPAMQERLRGFQDLVARWPGVELEGEAVGLDDAERKALEALGYVDP